MPEWEKEVRPPDDDLNKESKFKGMKLEPIEITGECTYDPKTVEEIGRRIEYARIMDSIKEALEPKERSQDLVETSSTSNPHRSGEMTTVTVDRELLNKVVKEASDLRSRVNYSTGQEFYNNARNLSDDEIRMYGLNARRLIQAVEQLFAKAQQYTEVPGMIPGTTGTGQVGNDPAKVADPGK